MFCDETQKKKKIRFFFWGYSKEGSMEGCECLDERGKGKGLS